MKILKLISKFGIFLAVGLIIVVLILENSSYCQKNGGGFVDFVQPNDVLFIVSLSVLGISLFLRVVASERQWKQLASFSKYFLPIVILFYIFIVFWGDKGGGIMESMNYWVGIGLAGVYGLVLIYFILKTFYDRW